MHSKVLALPLASALFAFASFAPATAATSAPPNCGTADAHVAAMPMPSPMASPSGSLDKDAATMMMALDKSMLAVATMEAACGNNQKERVMAQKTVMDLKQHINILNPFVEISI